MLRFPGKSSNRSTKNMQKVHAWQGIANSNASELLERRLGSLHAKQRLGIERDHEAQIFGQGLTFFHLENWYSIHSVIRTLFKLTGLY